MHANEANSIAQKVVKQITKIKLDEIMKLIESEAQNGNFTTQCEIQLSLFDDVVYNLEMLNYKIESLGPTTRFGAASNVLVIKISW